MQFVDIGLANVPGMHIVQFGAFHVPENSPEPHGKHRPVLPWRYVPGTQLRVGMSVGVEVGDALGHGVGFDVGDNVGDAVGLNVGDGVGTYVGDDEGELVGEGVGGVGA